ncbi:MAG: AAA family ATPase [Calditrichaeota bacterium]|nr:MAG: AAA family ATPase [Calditrichota bacterium]MBL1204577.1 AAA family ATPase [Calditrichota bacterium]NOG44406.1 sigma 54-interacting transcriptional regulator [Calditrichota bacterium]
MAFKAYKFLYPKIENTDNGAQLNVGSIKRVYNALNVEEMLFVRGSKCLTVFAFSDNVLPEDYLFFETIKSTFKNISILENERQIFVENNAIKHFFLIANGMDNSSNQKDFVKSFVNDYNLAKQETFVGAVFQRLFQRSIWLHEKVRLSTNYFNIAISNSDIFSDLACKIFENLSTVVVQIDNISENTYLTINALYRLGCRRFLFSGNAKDSNYLGEKSLPEITLTAHDNNLSNDADILIINQIESSLLDSERISTRMAIKNNAPLLILNSAEETEKKKLHKKFTSIYSYNYTDLERAIEKNKLERKRILTDVNPWIELEVNDFYNWLSSDSRYKFMGIIGSAPKMQHLFEMISRISQTDISVLIQGDSGTGKELVAKAVHNLSSRSEKPFIVVNCGAIPENLLESELFGHIRGSFTGAVADKNGLFFEANKGTIFLDEIGELPQQLQVKLLRFLQEGDIKPVGSNNTIKVDVRVVAATNKNLFEMVKKGIFRSDLFYRLNVMLLDLPTLKERKEDITILAGHFLRKYSTKFKKEVTEFSNKTLQYFQYYDWPGNIRELENAVEHAVALSLGKQVNEFDLPQTIRGVKVDFSSNGNPKNATLKDVEKSHILNTLNSTKWDYDKACKILGIGRTTLWRKLKEYDVKELP